MNFAFSKEEQNKIQTTYVEQDENPEYKDPDGNPRKNGENTYDKIFFLSYSEITNKQYGFCDTKIAGDHYCFSRKKLETDYALALGDRFNDETSRGYNSYWLRTKGQKGSYVLQVFNSDSSLGFRGDTIEAIKDVAPALNVSYSLSDCIKVTFNTNGAGTIEDQILLGSNYAKEPEVPVKKGYKFLGWYADKECSVPYEFNRKLTGDTTLYAGWIADSIATITEDTITKSNMAENKSIKGSSFCKIQARADQVTKKSVRLKWNKVKGADGYVIYGNKCGKKNKYKRVKTLESGKTVSYTQKRLKKGTYYKYIVKAYKKVNGEKVTIAVSKTIHVTTDGGKYGNAKDVKVNKNKTKVTLQLKKGKNQYKLKAKEMKKSKKIKKHRGICYESNNTKVATVSKNGIITAKGKGTCYIYAYAQNGKYKKIKVTVK